MKYKIYAFLTVLIIFSGILFLFGRNNKPDNLPEVVFDGTKSDLTLVDYSSAIKNSDDVSGQYQNQGNLKKYENKIGKFSLLYPENMKVAEYNEGGGSYSVTFGDSSTGVGFQIFFTLYKGDSISKQQFLLDNPSGIIDKQMDVLLDGVRATVFFSRNVLMGETREVWFIKNGFLYEVTTYKDLDAWLGQIMSTWKFQ